MPLQIHTKTIMGQNSKFQSDITSGMLAGPFCHGLLNHKHPSEIHQTELIIFVGWPILALTPSFIIWIKDSPMTAAPSFRGDSSLRKLEDQLGMCEWRPDRKITSFLTTSILSQVSVLWTIGSALFTLGSY